MKRALLVGIIDYPKNPLNGCVNDVETAEDYLKSVKGFAPGDIRKLTDGTATEKAIRDGLAWLVAGAAPGDTLYFHYSGHGTLFPEVGADGKTKALHCAIVPVDFNWSNGRPLLDSDMRTIIDQVPPGVDFLYVSDSCYSGDLTRATRWSRARALPPPAAIADRIAAAQAAGMAPQQLSGHDRCVLISGCRADQTSEDDYFDTGFHGALTYYLFEALKSGTWASSTLAALVAQVRVQLKANDYTQEPQLRGPEILQGKPFLTL